MINAVECANGDNPLNPTDDNPVDNTDSDGDGLTDNAEAAAGTNPNDPCSNTYSAAELCAFIFNNPSSPLATADCDNGGMINAVECANGGNPLNPADDVEDDFDGDGISDNIEISLGTDPSDPCSNNYTPAELCAFIANNPNGPLANADCDNGGKINSVECANGGNPMDGADDTPAVGCANFVIYECPDKMICGGGTAQLVVNGGVSWVWSPATGLDNPNSDIPKASPSETTIYTVTATDANGCTATAEVLVTVVNELKVYGGEDQTICAGQTATLDGQGGVQYQWSPTTGLSDPNIANPTANPTSTTTYTVTVTNPMGCTGTDQVTITVGGNLNVDATPGTINACPGETIQLGATGGTFYQWSPNTGLSNTNIADPTATPAVTTTYSVTVTDDNGCTGTTDMTIFVNTPSPVNAGADVTTCNGQNIQLNASGSSTYQWSPATGLSNPNISNPMASPATTTTYTVTGTDVNGCTSTDQVTVTVSTFVAEACEDKQICAGETLRLLVSSGASYNWSPAGTLDDPTSPAPVASPAHTTTYLVTVTNDAGCTSVDEVTLFVHDNISANAGADVSECPGQGTQLQATGGMSYQWSPTTGLSNPNIANPVANPDVTTVYTVSIMDFNGCTATDQMTYEVRTDCTPAPCPSILDQDEVCVDDDNMGRVCIPIGVNELNTNYRINTSDGVITPNHGCDFMPLYAYPYAILPNLGANGTYTIEAWTVNGTTFSGVVNNMDELAAWMQSNDPAGNWANITNNYFVQGGNPLSTYGDLLVMHEETWIETALTPSYTGVAQGTLVEVDMTGKDTEILTILDLATGCSDEVLIKKCTTPRCPQNLAEEVYTVAVQDCNEKGAICIPVKLENILDYDVTIDGAPYAGGLQGCYANSSFAYTYFTIPGQGKSGPYQISAWTVNGATFNGSFDEVSALISWMNDNDPAGNWILDETTLSIRGGATGSTYGTMNIVQINTRSKATLDVNTNLTPDGTELRFAVGTHQVQLFNTSTGCSDQFTVIVECLPTASIKDTIVEGQTGVSCLAINADRNIVHIENACADNAAMFTIDKEFQCVNYDGNIVGEHQACVVVCDDNNLCDTTYVNITVTPKSSVVPRAEQDVLTIDAETITVVDITANDRSASAVSIEIIKEPANGRAIINPDNTVSYEANEGYCNSTIADNFSYRICNTHGCDEAQVEVLVKCPGINVHKGFSPNYDGINDYLTIEGLQEYPNNELTVFNRWGTEIFNQKGYDGTWDGSFNGLPLPDGTYFYILTDGEGNKYSGFVQINR